MAEVTNELIYEVLKSMQGRLSNIENKLVEVDGRLQSLSTQMNAVHVDVDNLYRSSGHVNSRLARIEKRLEIIDELAE